MVFADKYGRLYYIDMQNDLSLDSRVEQEVECFIVLRYIQEPVRGPEVDERVYTFPEEDEVLKLKLTKRGTRRLTKAAASSAPTMTVHVHSPYQSGRSASGTAVLRITATAPDA